MNEKRTTKVDYLRRINLVVDYINQHLDEEIDLCTLADIACFSPFHFHRITKAFLGEPIGIYIARTRVETAARLLRYTDDDVAQIAYEVGYNSPSSLTRAFGKFFGVSPNEFRNNKKVKIMNVVKEKETIKLKAPKILVIQPKQLIYLRLTGKYSGLDFTSAISRLWSKVKSDGLFSAGIEHICIYHDDPKITCSEHLRTDVALAIHKPATAKDEIGVKTLEGGKYAVFTHIGTYSLLENVYDYIFSGWLPESGEQIDDRPCFEKYCNDPAKTQPEKLRTEIYVPIK